jgi:phosphoglucosamine mutase
MPETERSLFGTDGIRGKVGRYPLTEKAIFKLGRAVGLCIAKDRQKSSSIRCVIGRDTRQSGVFLEEAFSKGLGSCVDGAQIFMTGVLPTPAIAFLTKRLQADLGVVISASHNPGEDNGIKFFNSLAQKLSAAQERDIEQTFFNLGRLNRSKMRATIKRFNYGEQLYADFIKDLLKNIDLGGLEIVIDVAGGALTKLASSIFKELGADVTSLNDAPSAENINSHCGALFPEVVARATLCKRADVGFSFDGDGDRVIMSEEKGNILDGDYIMAILARYLLKKKKLRNKILVATHMSNRGLDLSIERAGGRVVRTSVGDKFVLYQMLKENANLGGEQSGHIILLDSCTTGDALAVSCHILKIMFESGRSLSDLARCMYKLPQVLVNVRVRQKKQWDQIPQLRKTVSYYERNLGREGRIFIRYSGTEPLARIMVEGPRRQLIDEAANSIATIIKKAIGRNA